MDPSQIVSALNKVGYEVIRVSGDTIIMEDPTCVVVYLTRFIDFAGLALGVLAVFLLAGWAFSMLRGADVDIRDNLRNMFLLFLALALAMPLVQFLLKRGELQCDELAVKISDVNELLNLKNSEWMSSMSSTENYDETPQATTTAPTTTTTTPTTTTPGNPTTPTTTPTTTTSTGKYVKATTQYNSNGNSYVVYTDKDGNKIRKEGGTVAWRANNPGNIRPPKKFSSAELGAIGVLDTVGNGLFLVFPDFETGKEAIFKLLRRDDYKNSSINEAIAAYAPKFENNTALYQKTVLNAIGGNVNGNTKVGNLSDAQLRAMVNAIMTHEGNVAGKITKL